jgi:Flp pilus assembly pilin Flp
MCLRFHRLRRDRRGQSIVEYGIAVGAVAIVSLAAMSLLGHKVGNLIGVAAAVLPADNSDDQGSIFIGKVASVDGGNGTPFTLSSTPGTLQNNLGLSNAAVANDGSGLITDISPNTGS